MRKSDLKTGMRVKTRNGSIMLVLKDVEPMLYDHQELVFVDSKGFLLGSEYTENMLDIENTEYDIMEVYSVENDGDVFDSQVLNLDVRHSIWKRAEYTAEQKRVFNALKTLGFNYVAKDRDSSVYAYVSRPTKRYEGLWSNMDEVSCVEMTNPVVGELVSWEDIEPFEIPGSF